MTKCVKKLTNARVFGAITLFISLGSSISFATSIEDAFSIYLKHMEPAYNNLQKDLHSDLIAVGQYSYFAEKSIAENTIYLAKLTHETYQEIKNLIPENEKDSERKLLILAELRERNTEWTSETMPWNIPLTLGCFTVAVKIGVGTAQRESEYPLTESPLRRAIEAGYVGLVHSVVVGAPMTAVCLIIAPFYDAAYYGGFEPIQNYQVDLKAFTKPFIITE